MKFCQSVGGGGINIRAGKAMKVVGEKDLIYLQ